MPQACQPFPSRKTCTIGRRLDDGDVQNRHVDCRFAVRAAVRVSEQPSCRDRDRRVSFVSAQSLCGGRATGAKSACANSLRPRVCGECLLPIHPAGGTQTMIRTIGAAIGAALVLLFLASVAAQLTWTGLAR